MALPINILVVAAHPDDAEIGMGGTIARLAHQGHRLLICDLTDGSPTPKGDRASRLIEAAAALDALQPSPHAPQPSGFVGPPQPIARVLLNLPNRTLTHSIETRHALAGVIRAHQARVLFIPHWEDAHPDHIAATRIAEDARFDAKLTKVDMPLPPAFPGFEGRESGAPLAPPIYPTWLFYYDISHLRRVMQPSFCLDITGYALAKQRSIRAYRSQFGPWDQATSTLFTKSDLKAATVHASNLSAPSPDPGKLVSSDFPERMLSYAAYIGSRIGVTHAEAFVTKEPVGLFGLNELTGM